MLWIRGSPPGKANVVMAGRNLPLGECSVCGTLTHRGEFLTAGRVNLLGQREWWNFVCFGCQRTGKTDRKNGPPRKHDSLGQAVK